LGLLNEMCRCHDSLIVISNKIGIIREGRPVFVRLDAVYVVKVENFIDAIDLNVVAEIFVSDTVVWDLDLFESLPLSF
jgi:hypothetical protein